MQMDAERNGMLYNFKAAGWSCRTIYTLSAVSSQQSTRNPKSCRDSLYAEIIGRPSSEYTRSYSIPNLWEKALLVLMVFGNVYFYLEEKGPKFRVTPFPNDV